MPRSLMLITTCALTLAPIPALGQKTGDEMMLGSIRLLQAQSEPLREKVPSNEVLGRVFGADVDAAFPFLARVGGIGFSTVAENQTNLHPQAFEITTRGEQMFFKVRFGDDSDVRTLSIEVPVWQLVPIVRFAESENTACFTLFGDLSSGTQPLGTWVVGYHPAFRNTLLGLRLMHADLIAFRDEAADCPRVGETAIIAPDETEPDVEANRRRIDTYLRWVDDQPIEYQSYLITDRTRAVAIVADGEELRLTGTPTWLYWRAGDDLEVWVVERLRIELQDDQAQLDEAVLMEKWTDEYVLQRAAELRREFFSTSRPRVHIHQVFSDAASTRIHELEGLCPLAFEPLVNTMRIAALLRYIRFVNDDLWQDIRLHCQSLTIGPAVDTPEILDYAGAYFRERSEDAEQP